MHPSRLSDLDIIHGRNKCHPEREREKEMAHEIQRPERIESNESQDIDRTANRFSAAHRQLAFPSINCVCVCVREVSEQKIRIDTDFSSRYPAKSAKMA